MIYRRPTSALRKLVLSREWMHVWIAALVVRFFPFANGGCMNAPIILSDHQIGDHSKPNQMGTSYPGVFISFGITLGARVPVEMCPRRVDAFIAKIFVSRFGLVCGLAPAYPTLNQAQAKHKRPQRRYLLPGVD